MNRGYEILNELVITCSNKIQKAISTKSNCPEHGADWVYYTGKIEAFKEILEIISEENKKEIIT